MQLDSHQEMSNGAHSFCSCWGVRGQLPKTCSMWALLPTRGKHWSTECLRILGVLGCEAVGPRTCSMLALFSPREKHWSTECQCAGAAPKTWSMLALFPHRDIKHWSTECQGILRMLEYAGVAPSSGSMLALLPPKDKNWSRCLLGILCMLEWERKALQHRVSSPCWCQGGSQNWVNVGKFVPTNINLKLNLN